MQEITLHFTQGGSDKVYRAFITPVDDQFTVSFAYGRRGSALRQGVKAESVSREKAQSVFDKLIKSKKSKGYTESETGQAYVQTDSENDVSGIHCQLLNTITLADVNDYINNPNYCAQRKYDGEHRLIERTGNETKGVNKKGLYLAISQPLVDASALVDSFNYIIDGEDLGDSLKSFDLLRLDGIDITHKPYAERYLLLRGICNDNGIDCVDTAFTTNDKRAMFEQLKTEGREGIVFKNVNATYQAGRPHSGGDQLKYKFVESCSMVVTAHNVGKRSVSFHAVESGVEVPMGNVTIQPNKVIPAVGDIIEILYLYCYPSGGSLYQPVYKGIRTDVDLHECTLSQLKYKRDEAA